MKNQAIAFFLVAYLVSWVPLQAQNVLSAEKAEKITKLFQEDKILNLKLEYSNKNLDRQTNDSTYLDTDIAFQQEDGSWKVLPSKIRARGNFRRNNCYFPPAKIKINKSVAEGTLFEGNKKLKLVLPCLQQKSANDDVVKEYLAYKLFEVISPYHFKTRLVNIDFTENRGKRVLSHSLKGFLIEDDDLVAERFDGNKLERFVHPLQQDAKTSLVNAFFQYLIANTDYSTAYQHNQKLLFIEKKSICIPYDFDMSGLVDASYSVVSQIQGEVLKISDVKQRLFRGFKRDEIAFAEVREEYLENKDQMFEVVDGLKSQFEDPATFIRAREFIITFFNIIEDDLQFRREIVNKARTK